MAIQAGPKVIAENNFSGMCPCRRHPFRQLLFKLYGVCKALSTSTREHRSIGSSLRSNTRDQVPRILIVRRVVPTLL
jgi:phosphatidylethanolamine-binding protein (PEBP) family uncharacterized protein